MATKNREGWVTTIFKLFRPTVLDKNATFLFIFIHIYLFIKLKKLHVGQFFLFVFVKFHTSYNLFTGLKALSPDQKQNLFHSF